eukprot:3548187-Pyramimonas_sp.AAC.1
MNGRSALALRQICDSKHQSVNRGDGWKNGSDRHASIHTYPERRGHIYVYAGIEIERERGRDRQTDRQADRQTG